MVQLDFGISQANPALSWLAKPIGFAASLPLSATDGTLRNRFNSPGMHGRIRLKTGRIDDVSALAGFVNAASGRTYVLVIMINHPGAHAGSGEAIQAELIRWVFGQ